MMIIAFSDKTGKMLPRVVCKKFKHCAPIVRTDCGLVMYHFVRRGHIYKIKLRDCDIRRMTQMGWKFCYINGECNRYFNPHHAMTCVGLTKRAIGIHRWQIQTPDSLYRYLN